jgi:hypothetical protein
MLPFPANRRRLVDGRTRTETDRSKIGGVPMVTSTHQRMRASGDVVGASSAMRGLPMKLASSSL